MYIRGIIVLEMCALEKDACLKLMPPSDVTNK